MQKFHLKRILRADPICQDALFSHLVYVIVFGKLECRAWEVLSSDSTTSHFHQIIFDV